MATEVSKNEDGTWHAPGAGDHRTKAEATVALERHQAELQARREEARETYDRGVLDLPDSHGYTRPYTPA